MVPVDNRPAMRYVDQMSNAANALHVPQGFVKNSYDLAVNGMLDSRSSWIDRGVNLLGATAMLPLAGAEELIRGMLNTPSSTAEVVPLASNGGTQLAMAFDSSLPTDARVVAGLTATRDFSTAAANLLGLALAGKPAFEIGNVGIDGTANAANNARGLSKNGGIFSSTTNEAGGTIWTSEGPISQNDFGHIVNSELMQGRDVNIITGVHGNVDGTIASIDAEMHLFDVDTFGEIPGVTVHNFPELTPDQLKVLLNGKDTVIGGFCSSGACLAPYR
jgi:hypothetical protein